MYPATTPPTTPAPAAAPARGPGGTRREPWLVVILTLVTMGLYALYYWWVTSREMDASTRRPGHAHGPVRIGVIVSAAAAILLAFLLATFFATLLATILSGRAPDARDMLGTIAGGILLLFLASTAGLVGAILLLVGKYRIWEAIEQDERRRGHPTPLSAALMVILSLAALVIPFIGMVLPLVVLYMTQDHLEQAWATPSP